MKTKRYTGLIYTEDVQEIVYAESNGHLVDDVTQPYDVIVVTYCSMHIIRMILAPEAGAINRLHFPALVSGTCVMQIWDRIRLVPETGAE